MSKRQYRTLQGRIKLQMFENKFDEQNVLTLIIYTQYTTPIRIYNGPVSRRFLSITISLTELPFFCATFPNLGKNRCGITFSDIHYVLLAICPQIVIHDYDNQNVASRIRAGWWGEGGCWHVFFIPVTGLAKLALTQAQFTGTIVLFLDSLYFL